MSSLFFTWVTIANRPYQQASANRLNLASLMACNLLIFGRLVMRHIVFDAPRLTQTGLTSGQPLSHDLIECLLFLDFVKFDCSALEKRFTRPGPTAHETALLPCSQIVPRPL